MIGFELHFTSKISGVYAFTHTATGRQYVGSSVDLYKRVSKHLSELRKDRHHSPILQNAWKKYGEEAFAFSVIEEVPDHAGLIGREQHWLDTLQPHYNVCKTAQSVLGIKRSPETRQRMSEAMRGVKKSPEHIEKMRQVSSQRRHTDEVKRICGDAARGVKKPPRTTEHTAKLIAHQVKSYVITAPDGNEEKIVNLRQFCRDQGLDQGNMTKVLSGRAAHHKGWKVRYDAPPGHFRSLKELGVALGVSTPFL